MAYDQELADQIRSLIGLAPDLSEKQMFGGLAFLIDGHMAVAASGHGGLLVRVDPAKSADIVSSSAAEPMVMRGRSMPGWLRVDDKEITDAADLKHWVAIGVSYARSLPPK